MENPNLCLLYDFAINDNPQNNDYLLGIFVTITIFNLQNKFSTKLLIFKLLSVEFLIGYSACSVN